MIESHPSATLDRRYSWIDRLIMEIDQGLRTVVGHRTANRPNPAEQAAEHPLSPSDKQHSIALMRINHTGEVCAQALYRGQLSLSRSQATRIMLQAACEEEVDHLAWTQERLQALRGRRSYLNAYWYLHSFWIGMLAASLGDAWSLGFVEETEEQVQRHLNRHLQVLAQQDEKSRSILEQMRRDEIHHGQQAQTAGSAPLPTWVKKWMALQSKVMTALTYYI